MVRSIANIKQHLSGIAATLGVPNDKCVFEALSSHNEETIKSLINEYGVDVIDAITPDIKALHFSKINEYYNKGYFVFQNKDGRECYAINNISIIKEKHLDSQNQIPVFFIRKKDLLQIIERDFSVQNTDHAINVLENTTPNSSAKNINYPKMLFGSWVIFFSTFFLFLKTFYVINNFVYLLQNMLKVILFKRGMVTSENSPIAAIDDSLPIYSVFIPLYREELKVNAILKAMGNMNYPKDKLDVKLIIEGDDLLTIRALAVLTLPSCVHVIKVPYSLPRTKPKALNYAMAYAKGEMITIYDAEDEPDPDQLLKVIYAFNTLPDHFACVQAKLNFYNAKENFLTRLFSIEYSVWFEYLLQGLSMLDLPVTLGGTSNHFKIDKLKEVGYWDAYNVTEDADLGIRLYLHGYKVHLINSTTLEEAPIKISTWIAQRARWIKGFIQTFYIFIKTKKDLSKFNITKICTVYIFVGLSTYSFLCLPWLILALTMNTHYIIYYMCIINGFFSFSYMYTIGYLVLSKDKTTFKYLSLKDWITLLIWPLYFILHTIASYRAIWEALVSPFKWNKTPHGNSKDYLE